MNSKSKKILVVTFGSRGDIQPMLGLAIALKNAGHEILFQGPKIAGEFAKKYDIPFTPLSGDPEALLKSETCKEVLKTGDFMKLKGIPEWEDSYGRMADDIAKAAVGNDLLIAVAGISDQVYLVNKKTKIPLIIAMLQPFYPTSKFGYIANEPNPFGKSGEENLKSWDINTKSSLGFYAPVIKKWVDNWELKYLDYDIDFWHEIRYVDKFPMIGGFSVEAIGQRPDDWPEHVQIAGYFDIESDPSVKLAKEIEEFLDEVPEEKPIFLSFGSMPFADPKFIVSLAKAIVDKLGKRVILSAGWSKLDSIELPKDKRLLVITGAPYDLLFPRCSVIIHHGGAGTTGIALKSGTSQVVVAFFMDQPFFGQAMHRIGVASKQLDYSTLKEEELLECIKYAEKEEVQKRAKEIGERVRNEDGRKKAAELVDLFYEKYFSNSIQTISFE